MSDSDVLEKALRSVVGSKLDDPVLAYLPALVLERDPLSKHTSSSIAAALNDMLLDYEAASSPDEVVRVCEEVHKLLGSRVSSAAPSSAPDVLRAGASVMAQFRGDGKWYQATVVEMMPGGNVKVHFTDYGDTDEVEPSQVRAGGGGGGGGARDNAPQLLKAPVSIATGETTVERERRLKIERRQAEEREMERNAAEMIAKVNAKLEEEAKRVAAAVERLEKQRLRRAAERRERAVQLFLDARNSAKAAGQRRSIAEIEIRAFSMGTVDAGKELLTNTTLRIVMGRRYGLVGRNGSGKTTLLQHIANYEVDGFPTALHVVHVEQEVVGDSTAVLETVMRADLEREVLLGRERELKVLTDAASSAELSAVYDRMREIDSWTAEARASTILAGLGFTPAQQQMSTSTLSGGWRMRVALASGLFVQPDILLLDEPTNHLDLPALLWLQDYLRSYEKTVVVVSHDRDFLNSVVTDVVHLIDKGLVYYRGDYDTFERVRADMIKAHRREQDSQQRQREHMQKFIDKFRYNAKRASLVQSRIKAMNRLELLEDIAEDPAFHLAFPVPLPVGGVLVQCSHVNFNYPGERGRAVARDAGRKYLLEDISVNVTMQSRVGIAGANGAGKSTLVKIMTGELVVPDGGVVRNGNCRISMFAQHHMDTLDPGLTPVQQLCKMFKAQEPEVRAHLGRFGVSGDLALQHMRTLSGGQKSRVAFAVVTWNKPQMIIMDEPTNHLDAETIEALILACSDFPGALIIVSHEAHFLDSVCEEFWGVSDGRLKVFPDFDSCKKFCYQSLPQASLRR